jgi:hypothetical protein
VAYDICTVTSDALLTWKDHEIRIGLEKLPFWLADWPWAYRTLSGPGSFLLIIFSFRIHCFIYPPFAFSSLHVYSKALDLNKEHRMFCILLQLGLCLVFFKACRFNVILKRESIKLYSTSVMVRTMAGEEIELEWICTFQFHKSNCPCFQRHWQGCFIVAQRYDCGNYQLIKGMNVYCKTMGVFSWG